MGAFSACRRRDGLDQASACAEDDADTVPAGGKANAAATEAPGRAAQDLEQPYSELDATWGLRSGAYIHIYVCMGERESLSRARAVSVLL